MLTATGSPTVETTATSARHVDGPRKVFIQWYCGHLRLRLTSVAVVQPAYSSPKPVLCHTSYRQTLPTETVGITVSDSRSTSEVASEQSTPKTGFRVTKATGEEPVTVALKQRCTPPWRLGCPIGYVSAATDYRHAKTGRNEQDTSSQASRVWGLLTALPVFLLYESEVLMVMSLFRLHRQIWADSLEAVKIRLFPVSQVPLPAAIDSPHKQVARTGTPLLMPGS